MKIFIIALFCLVIPTLQLFEQSSQIKEIQNFREFQEFISQKDFTVSLFFYNTYDCDKCQQVATIYDKFSEEMEGIVEFAAIDCDKMWEDKDSQEQLQLCNPKQVGELPQLVFFSPPQQRYKENSNEAMMPIQHNYQGEVDYKKMANFTKNILPSFSKFIESEADLKEFLDFTAIPNKVILFTKKNETSPLFSGLTSYFRERMDFGVILANQTQLTKKYKIAKFPSLIVLELQTNGNYNQINYTEKIQFDQIKKFLDNYSLKRKLLRQGNRPQVPEDSKPTFIEISNDKLETDILNKQGFALLHLFKNENKKHKQLDALLENFEHLFEYFEINCNDSEEANYFLENYQISEYPALIYFQSGTSEQKIKNMLVFKKKNKFKEIFEEIKENLEDSTKPINSDNAQLFVLNSMEQKKIPVVFFDKSTKTDSYFFYKAFASLEKFNDKLIFGSGINPTNEIKKIFKITEDSALLAVLKEGQGDHQVAHFKGDVFDAKSLRQFINDVNSRALSITPEIQPIQEIESQDQFEMICNIKKHDYCFLAFLDGSKRFTQTRDRKLKNQLELLDTILDFSKQKQLKVSINWIDGICFEDLLKKLYIFKPTEKLPLFLGINPQDSQYSYMDKPFSEENIKNYITQVANGDITFHKPKEEIDIDDRNCENFYKKKSKTEL